MDDGSSSPRVGDVLASAAQRDRRVRIFHHDRNAGIVAASTTALEQARGEYVAMLDHDDVLAPNALQRLVNALRDHPDAPFAYSDNDVLRRDGRLAEPFFKPDFSPERLRNHNYVLHCVMAPIARVRAVGGFRPGFDGAQDHDLLLRLSELGPPVHVPEVLYHWREAPASVASDPGAKPYAYEAGVRAVQEHCDRVGIEASVAPGVADGVYRLQRSVPHDLRVSIVIPTRGTTAAVWGVDRVLVHEAMRSIVEHSTFANVEFVVVADADTPDAVVAGVRAIGGDATTGRDRSTARSTSRPRSTPGARCLRRSAAVPQRRHGADRARQHRRDGGAAAAARRGDGGGQAVVCRRHHAARRARVPRPRHARIARVPR